MELKRFVIQQVERLMSKNGYTQLDMAHVIECGSKSAFNKRMTGHTAFSTPDIIAMSEEFNKDINYFLKQSYEQEQKELQEFKDAAPQHGFGNLHDPTERTITISVDIPISGGLNIPEDISDRIREMILQNR
mgnify:CR=1 FL=1